MTNLHGKSFVADICWEPCSGKISVNPKTGFVYLCQDNLNGSSIDLPEKFGYKYAWLIGESLDELTIMDGVSNLKILPDSLEYHELFEELMSSRKSSWDEVDGHYWVVEKSLVEKVAGFLKGIEVKNPGK